MQRLAEGSTRLPCLDRVGDRDVAVPPEVRRKVLWGSRGGGRGEEGRDPDGLGCLEGGDCRCDGHLELAQEGL